jgi:hypothetical protein
VRILKDLRCTELVQFLPSCLLAADCELVRTSREKQLRGSFAWDEAESAEAIQHAGSCSDVNWDCREGRMPIKKDTRDAVGGPEKDNEREKTGSERSD